MVSIQCNICQSSFSVKNYRKNTAKYCSFECYWKSISGKKKGPLSKEIKRKLSESKTGKKRTVPPWNKGKKLPQLSGENHWRWISDRTKLSTFGDPTLDRRSSAYVTWRNEIYRRDNYLCKISNEDCSGKIEAHHILGFKEHPELRYDINNGITLCHYHHPRKRKDEVRLSPYFSSIITNQNDNIRD